MSDDEFVIKDADTRSDRTHTLAELADDAIARMEARQAQYATCRHAVADMEQFDRDTGSFALFRAQGMSPVQVREAVKMGYTTLRAHAHCAVILAEMDEPSFLLYLAAKLGAM